MGCDPDGSGGVYYHPQRKRVRIIKILETEQSNVDIERQEESEISKGALG
jgi:hypothetical protein